MTITKFNLSHVKHTAAPLLGFMPSGHNDTSTLFINCGQKHNEAEALARSVQIPNVIAHVKMCERPGSIAQHEQWDAEGTNQEYYLCLYRGWDGTGK